MTTLSEIEQKAEQLGLRPPLHDFIGMYVEEDGSEGGPSRVVMGLSEATRGAVAPLHGGLVAALVDVACASAIGMANYDVETVIPVSIDLSVRFFRQPKSGPVVGVGRIVNRGSKLIQATCDVTDGEGRSLAQGQGTYLLVESFGR
jgi:uncharacterized protein (TIGR00369 family)